MKIQIEQDLFRFAGVPALHTCPPVPLLTTGTCHQNHFFTRLLRIHTSLLETESAIRKLVIESESLSLHRLLESESQICVSF